jgi:DNA-binding NtrC family response regulator
MLDVDSLPPRSDSGSAPPLAPDARSRGSGPDDFELEPGNNLAERIERIVAREEKRIILAALRKMNQRRQETADLLGISRKSLHNKMQKYGLLKSKGGETTTAAPIER